MSDLSNQRTSHPDINCPSCASVVDVGSGQAEITCPVCNGHFTLAGHLCPSCGNYHDEERAACDECGSPLVRLCRQCQTTNWTGDEICISCGAAIDMLSQVIVSSQQSTSDRLSQQMVDAKSLKEVEAAASDKRMAELMAIEEARQAELRLRRVEQKRQERKMLIVVFAAVLLFLLALVSFALFSGIN